MPVVFDIHGYLQPGFMQAAWSGMSAHGARHGFAVITPETHVMPPKWDIGEGGQDVAYLSALLTHVEKALCVDKRRVYITGLSMGAFTTSSLACQMADRFAAAAPVAAPPTVWRMLIQADLSHLTRPPRELVGAGEALNPEVINKVRDAWGNTIRDGYGQTEMTCCVGNSPGQPVRIGAMGRPMPGYAVVLCNSDEDPAREERHARVVLPARVVPGRPGGGELRLEERPARRLVAQQRVGAVEFC